MFCFTFMVLVSALFFLIRSLIVPRTALAAENLALRQQLAVLNRKIHRPHLHRQDRFLWAPLATLEELAGGLNHRQTGDRHQLDQQFPLCTGGRTSPSRFRPCGIDCGEISSQGQRVSVTNLEDISRQSCKADCRYRLFHRSDRRRNWRRIIGEWARHRQDAIFGTDKDC
jgi:hypothetical protein